MSTPTESASDAHSLPESVVDRLRTFQLCTEQLYKRRLVQAPKTTKFTAHFAFGPEQEGRTAFEGHDEDDLRSFAVDLRKFVMVGEQMNLGKTAGLIHRHCDRRELVEWSDLTARSWRDVLNKPHPSFSITINGENSPCSKLSDGTRAPLTVLQAWNTLWYGGVFHADPTQVKRFRSLSPASVATIQMIAETSIRPLVSHIRNIDAVITYWLDKPNEPVPDPDLANE